LQCSALIFLSFSCGLSLARSLLLLGTLSRGAVFVAGSLAAALRLLLLLLLLLLHVLAVRALLTCAALARAVLTGLLARLPLGLRLSALLLALDFLLCRQVLLIVAILLRVVLHSGFKLWSVCLACSLLIDYFSR